MQGSKDDPSSEPSSPSKENNGNGKKKKSKANETSSIMGTLGSEGRDQSKLLRNYGGVSDSAVAGHMKSKDDTETKAAGALVSESDMETDESDDDTVQQVRQSRSKRIKKRIKGTISKAMAAKFFRKRTEIPKGIPENAVPGKEEGVWYGYFPYDSALADPFWVWWFIQVFGCLLTAGLAGTAWYFSYGPSTPLIIAVGSIAFAIAIDIGMYAEWAYNYKDKHIHLYLHLLLLYLMNFALLTLSVYVYISIPEGEQYFTENWWSIQSQVLPFTTLLDAKSTYRLVNTVLMALGVSMFAINFIAILRAWNALGGMISMVQHGLKMMLPQLLVVFVTAGASAGLSLETADVCMFAREYQPHDVYLMATVSFLLAVTVIVLCFLSCRWGNHHLTFSANGTFYLVFATILLIAGSVVQGRSSSTTSFVEENWSTLKNFVPENYADKSWHKYALRCTSLMSQTATMAILCSIFSILYSFSALRAAFVSISLGEGGFEALVEENIKHSQSIGKRSMTAGYGATEGGSDSLSGTSDTEWYSASQWNKALADLDLNKSGTVKHRDSSASFTTSDFSETPEPSQDPSELLKQHPLPSATEWVYTSWNDFKVMCREHTKYSVFVGALFLAAVIAIGVGMANTADQLHCYNLVHNPYEYSLNFSAPLRSDTVFELKHRFPRGTVSVVDITEWPSNFKPLKADHYGVVIREWSFKSRPVFDVNQFVKDIFSSNSSVCSDSNFEQDCSVTMDFSPSALGRSRSESEDACDAVEVVIYYPFTGATNYGSIKVDSESAFVNVTAHVDFSIKLLSEFLGQLTVTTNNAPVLLADIVVQTRPTTTIVPNVNLKSQSGDVTLNLVLAHGISIETGGDILSQNAISFDFNAAPASGEGSVTGCLFAGTVCLPIDGDVSLTAHSNGRILASKLVMANNFLLNSDGGRILGQNSVSYIIHDTRLVSNHGEVTLNSWLPLSGNLTFIRTKAAISGSFVFANIVDAESYSSSVSFLEIFLGLNKPDAHFLPEYDSQFNYSLPGIRAVAEKGSVSMIGLGAGLLNGNPDENWAADLSIKGISEVGSVKMQVNGGGFTGKYKTESKFGNSAVEISGKDAPTSGIIDPNSEGVGFALLKTKRGDTQLVVLPSPLGAEIL